MEECLLNSFPGEAWGPRDILGEQESRGEEGGGWRLNWLWSLGPCCPLVPFGEWSHS